ncbi:MAG: hypothetical protein JWO44_242 [Bacteroidetes bacterium]|nr:hypothetical protein [Bacteroidota bacterium]
MVFTVQYKDEASAFYTAPTGRSNGFTGFFIYAKGLPDELSFTDCFDPLKYKGYFIFLASAPAPKAFISHLKELLPFESLSHTHLLWINATDPAKATADELILLKLSSEGIQQDDVKASWGKYGISIPAGSKVTAEIRAGINGLAWSMPLDSIHPQPRPFFLPFHGDDRGLLITRASIADFSDASATGWDVGFRYFMKGAGSEEIVSQYYPLFHPEKNTNVLFKLSWDLTSSKRTTLEFEAHSFIMEPAPDQPGSYRLQMPEKPERLRTWLRTDMGIPVYLYPLSNKLMPGQGARLVLSALPGDDYYWAPDGCFELGLKTDPAQPSTYYLLCGLSGVETLSFQPRSAGRNGDVLRFESGKPAYVYNFPGIPAEVVLQTGPQKSKKKNAPHAPGDLYIAYSRGRTEVAVTGTRSQDASSYLDNTYQTSWMKIRSFTGASGGLNYYYAQPSTSPLYGGATGVSGAQQYPAPGQTGISDYSFMPFFRPPSKLLSTSAKPSAIHFPMVPAAGAVSNPGTQQLNSGVKSQSDFLSFFEEQVLAPSRTEQVMKNQPGVKMQLQAGESNSTSYSTSPQGLLVKIGETDFKWKKLLFAYTEADKSIAGSVTAELSFSKLSDQLQAAFQKNQMFLVMSLLPAADAANFKNEIAIQGWPFKLNVPESTTGSDYRNVIIFKFTSGSIKELVTKPSEWTSAGDFNTNPADVSQWLSNYINKEERLPSLKSRYNDQPSLYTNFNQVVNSDSWTGVLALNVDINLQDFPAQIKGLIGGIDMEKFEAHHFGIEVNQVIPDIANGGLKFAQPSSLFGLIDYKGGTAAPKMPYDFKVDLLQVLFMNTTIADFRCNISLTLGSLFGDAVSFTPPPPQPSTINLTGTYEKHEGVATYSFLSDTHYTLSNMQGTVWKSIVLSKIQFFTLSQEGTVVNSVFSFWGDMLFNNIGKEENFDLFSFDQLAFGGMQLLMNFNIPAKRTTKTVLNFVFDPSAITFNNSVSAPRAGSLFQNFPLDAKGMAFGDSRKLPSGKGYFKIDLPLKNPAEISSTWYALRYDLDLGTPGALAEKAGFTASILACWTPYDKYTGTQIAAYLQLPGSSGLLQTVLQSVLTLSVGNAEFSSEKEQQANPIYKLALKNIALKVLGFSIPPGGETNASLFTNEEQPGKKDSTGWYIAYNKKE